MYAFSLVELLVVIGIAGILMAAAVPAWHSYYRHLTAMTVANNVVSDINYVRSYSMKMEGYGAFAYSPSRDSYVVCSGVDDGVDESGNPRLVRGRFTNNNTTIYNYVAADGTQTTGGVPSFSGYTGGTFNPADYEYLRALDHSLGIKGNVYGSIDLGFARYMGTKGSKLSLGVSLDLQPVKFEYNGTSKDKFHYSVGPKAGFSF